MKKVKVDRAEYGRLCLVSALVRAENNIDFLIHRLTEDLEFGDPYPVESDDGFCLVDSVGAEIQGLLKQAFDDYWRQRNAKKKG